MIRRTFFKSLSAAIATIGLGAGLPSLPTKADAAAGVGARLPLKADAIAGIGTRLTRDGFAPVGELVAIHGPTMTREFIDVTDLGSDNNYREFITGFRDAGSVSIEMDFTREREFPPWMNVERDAAELHDYRIEYPDPDQTSLEFSAYDVHTQRSIDLDGQLRGRIELKIVGQVTMAVDVGE